MRRKAPGGCDHSILGKHSDACYLEETEPSQVKMVDAYLNAHIHDWHEIDDLSMDISRAHVVCKVCGNLGELDYETNEVFYPAT